jgi:hypothetical protein
MPKINLKTSSLKPNEEKNSEKAKSAQKSRQKTPPVKEKEKKKPRKKLKQKFDEERKKRFMREARRSMDDGIEYSEGSYDPISEKQHSMVTRHKQKISEQRKRLDNLRTVGVKSYGDMF